MLKTEILELPSKLNMAKKGVAARKRGIGVCFLTIVGMAFFGMRPAMAVPKGSECDTANGDPAYSISPCHEPCDGGKVVTVDGIESFIATRTIAYSDVTISHCKEVDGTSTCEENPIACGQRYRFSTSINAADKCPTSEIDKGHMTYTIAYADGCS